MPTESKPAAESDPARIPSTDGVTLAVHELGRPRRLADSAEPGQGTTDTLCLIAHATGFHGRCYRVLAEELSGSVASTRILAPDLRGHGDSTGPRAGDYSWDGFAQDLLAVLERADCPRVRGIGHSMGGAALLRAEQLRPGTFERLFVYEPIVYPPQLRRSGATSPLVGAAERRRSHFASHQDALARFASKPPLDVLDPRCLEDYVRWGFRDQDPDHPERGIVLKLPGPEEAAVYRMSTVHATWDELPSVEAAVTVARGTAEAGAPVEVAPRLVERLPEGRLVDFDTLGHFGPLQDPRAVARAVIDSWSSA